MNLWHPISILLQSTKILFEKRSKFILCILDLRMVFDSFPFPPNELLSDIGQLTKKSFKRKLHFRES